MSVVRGSRRRSPIRHSVKDHVRNGKPIGQFERGSGERSLSDPRRGRVVGVDAIGSYDVTIFYVDSPSEFFSVDAKNFRGALLAGIEQREKPLPPRVIRMRRGN